MTRGQFEAFMRVEQWPAEKVAFFRDITPTCSAEMFRDEAARPDGIIEVKFERPREDRWHALRRRPFLVRFWLHYWEYQRVGLGWFSSLRWAFYIAR